MTSGSGARGFNVNKKQPGLSSIQTYRGTAGRPTFGLIAVWGSAKALGDAFLSSAFQALAAGYPDSTGCPTRL